MWKHLVLATVLLLSALRAEVVEDPTFGFGTMRVNGTSATGSRPLLGILMEYSDVRFRHNTDYYENLLFGARTPSATFQTSLAGYFHENSGGRFRWTRAGLVTVRHPDDPATRTIDESLHACVTVRPACPSAMSAGRNWIKMLSEAIVLAGAGGFDFARFDANRDGRVTEQELTIIVINAEPPPSAAGRPSLGGNVRTLLDPGSCVRVERSRVNVCGEVGIMGEAVGLATMAHEVNHLLGGEEAYGSRFRNNVRMTLMAGTISAREDDRTIYHLDPWHKIRLGWVTPRAIPINLRAPGRSATLRVPQGTGYEPIVFYDPARGENEFIILEARNPGAGGHDGGVADSGIALWYLKTQSNDALLNVPSEILAGPDGTLQSVVAAGSDDARSAQAISAGADLVLQSRTAAGSDDVLGTDGTVWVYGAPDHQRGVGRLWREEHGPVVVRWPGDGARVDTGVRFRVGPMSPTTHTIDVEWSFGDRPFIARIDKALTSSRTVRAGNLIALDGMFGVRGASRVASFTKGSRFYDLPVESWTQSRITLRVPDGIPPDLYGLCIYNDREHKVGSSPYFFTVEK